MIWRIGTGVQVHITLLMKLHALNFHPNMNAMEDGKTEFLYHEESGWPKKPETNVGKDYSSEEVRSKYIF